MEEHFTDYLLQRISELEKFNTDLTNRNLVHKEQIETLKGEVRYLNNTKETPTLKDAFIAGYKKRALMSGLKYDEVSELSAITNFKCWKSFDLNL